jgi:hypothetical protein
MRHSSRARIRVVWSGSRHRNRNWRGSWRIWGSSRLVWEWRCGDAGASGKFGGGVCGGGIGRRGGLLGWGGGETEDLETEDRRQEFLVNAEKLKYI